MSTGNVIVGTWTIEYADHQHLLLMAPDAVTFPDRFQEAVDRFADLNTVGKRTERITFASERTVDDLIIRIATLMDQT